MALSSSLRSRRLLWMALAVPLLAGVTAFAVWAWRPRPADDDPADVPAPDPRVTYDGPFQNVRPGVQYVGDAACADCHHDIVQTYRQHPMGRSLTPMARFAARQRYDNDVNNPFQAFGLRFRVDRRGDEVFHEVAKLDAKGEPLCQLKLKADYVIGSGAHGHSYLTERDGYVFQTPISWYTQQNKWERSPGFTEQTLSGRAVVGDCLFCHVNRVEAVPDALNRYHLPLFRGHAIGCERCHGPGELHVRGRSLFEPVAGTDASIVNPRHLQHALREAVCQQCHLEGEKRVLRRGRDRFDFRPGLPLEAVFSVFVRAAKEGEDFKAVTHVEQMYLSRCFRAGSGASKMGCISCHNPHEAVGPDRRVAYYRERCLQCHGGKAADEKGCAEPLASRLAVSPQDSCIDCHMPLYSASDIVHTAATDHRILRKKGESSRGYGPAPSPDGLPLTPFHLRPDARDPELRRDLALALAALLDLKRVAPLYVNPALDLLDEAVTKFPRDVAAREARARLLAGQQRPTDSLAGFKMVLALAPDREIALASAASLAGQLGDAAEAVALWRRAVEVNLWEPEYRRNLAVLLARQGNWDEAAMHCRAWRELNPLAVEAHRMWRDVLLRQGRREEADAEQALLRALQRP